MALRPGELPADFLARLAETPQFSDSPQISPHQHDVVSDLGGGDSEGERISEGSVVGTGGIEPPTPTVSRWCSPTELRA